MNVPRSNDRTVYDSEGQIVCRPLMALGPENQEVKERPTIPGLQAVERIFVEPPDEDTVFVEVGR
jgi:hypothetical protein